MERCHTNTATDQGVQADRLVTYLEHRGIPSEVLTQIPGDVLSLAPELEYWDPKGTSRGRFPAMVARVTDAEGQEVTVHRTYLDPAGPGKLDLGPDCPAKKLASVSEAGATRGASIKLAPPGSVLGVAEGIETALAVMHATGHPCWSCVSAAMMQSVQIPDVVGVVHIWADNDANEVGQRVAERLAERLTAEGRRVHVHVPPTIGQDWLDVLNASGAASLLDELTNGSEWRSQREGASANAVRLSEVQPEQVDWLWPGRIPLGKICILDGDPGLGKSTVTLDIAARVTRGAPMPDGSEFGEPAAVVLVSAEDGVADTIVPRLVAAGAELGLVWALEHCGEDSHPFTLPDDIGALEQLVRQTRARLVVIDPLMAFLNTRTNAHRDQDTRYVLARVHDMAKATGAAVLLVRHLNKMAGGAAIYRGGGSIGIIGAARSGLLVAKDPEDGHRRVLACTKQNLAVLPPSLAFRLEGADGQPATVIWEGAIEHDANTLLAPPITGQERTERDEAMDFLREVLAAGPVAAKRVKAMAAEAGISDMTLRRARLELGVRISRDGYQGKSYWSLDAIDAHEPHTCSCLEDEQQSPSVNTYERNSDREFASAPEPQMDFAGAFQSNQVDQGR